MSSWCTWPRGLKVRIQKTKKKKKEEKKKKKEEGNRPVRAWVAESVSLTVSSLVFRI